MLSLNVLRFCSLACGACRLRHALVAYRRSRSLPVVFVVYLMPVMLVAIRQL